MKWIKPSLNSLVTNQEKYMERIIERALKERTVLVLSLTESNKIDTEKYTEFILPCKQSHVTLFRD